MLEFMLNASIVMYPLMFCSIMALALVLDRWRVFRLAEKGTGHIRERVMDLLYEGKVDEAIAMCEQSHGPVAAVLLTGLNRFRQLLALNRAPAEIEALVTKAMDDYVPHVMAPLEKRVGSLSMIATVAPLLGMAGTVTGMIRSFVGVSQTGLEGNLVAAGVAEALINTAAGLLIAIPAAVLYHFFTKKLEHHTLEISKTGTSLIDYITIQLAAHSDAGAQK